MSEAAQIVSECFASGLDYPIMVSLRGEFGRVHYEQGLADPAVALPYRQPPQQSQDYITGLWSSDADEVDVDDDPVNTFIRPLLETENVPDLDVERVCSALTALWEKQTGAVVARQPAKLDVALDMRRQELLSKKQTIVSAVDIASVGPLGTLGRSAFRLSTFRRSTNPTDP